MPVLISSGKAEKEMPDISDNIGENRTFGVLYFLQYPHPPKQAKYCIFYSRGTDIFYHAILFAVSFPARLPRLPAVRKHEDFCNSVPTRDIRCKIVNKSMRY